MEYLSQEEVEALPDNTEVIVTWSGGNGPHKYIITHQVRGTLGVKTGRPFDYIHSLSFVGAESYHTRVSLALT